MWKAVPQKYHLQDSYLWTYNSVNRSVRNAEFKTLAQVRIDKTWKDRFEMYFDTNRNMEHVTQYQGWSRVMYLKRYCEMAARAGDHRDLIDQLIWEDFQQLEVVIYSERNGKFMVSRGHPKFLCRN
jgi:tetrahydromethanopterin S-methyltransferase subunit H